MVYIDLVVLLNFTVDFVLLFLVRFILKRNVSLKRIILGSLVGSLSIVVLFIQLNKIELLLFKFILSVMMSLATFSYKNLEYTLKNITFLYLNSFIVSGFLYFLKIENMKCPVILLPIIILIYIKEIKGYKSEYSSYYKINLYEGESKYSIDGFLDTGNTLKSYSGRPVVVVNIGLIDFNNTFFLPIKTAGEDSLMRCMKMDKIEVIGVGVYKNIIVGETLTKINTDCLINALLMEELK